MTKMDDNFKKAVEYINREGSYDVNPRPYWLEEDGSHTPAHTKFVTAYTNEYRLDKGEFPMLTLRPSPWKTGMKEVFNLFFYQGIKISDFEMYSVNYWADWEWSKTNLAKEYCSNDLDGTIGKSYPYNLESHRDFRMPRDVVRVKTRLIDETLFEKKNILINPIEQKYIEKNEFYQLIEIYVEDRGTYKRKKAKIQSLENGAYYDVTMDAWKENMKNPHILIGDKFNYERNVYGVGYLGNFESVGNFTTEEVKILRKKWYSMIERGCSGVAKVHHPTYKNKGVHQDWHSFEQFLRDIREIPQYFVAREDNFKGWELDKDYYNSNGYSKNTCVFLSHEDNKLYEGKERNTAYLGYRLEDGLKEVIINGKDFNKKYGHRFHILEVANPNNKSYIQSNGWKFEKIDLSDKDYVYRYELSRNQMIELIKGIKENPYGRRHMTSFYNWANMNKKSLTECCFQTMWTVRGEYLDMTLIQRSGDLLGASIGMNEIQYAGLLVMVAWECGLKPGKFVHFIQNLHIYDRHIQICEELCKRETVECNPMLIIDTDKKSIFDLDINDFKMIDYPMDEIKKKNPQVKFPLAI